VVKTDFKPISVISVVRAGTGSSIGRPSNKRGVGGSCGVAQLIVLSGKMTETWFRTRPLTGKDNLGLVEGGLLGVGSRESGLRTH